MKINKHIVGRHSLNNALRYFVFIIFYILSVRSVLVYLNYLTGSVQFIGIIAIVIGLAVCWWKIIWVLYLFIACIPLISGIQELGFMKSAPLVGFLFSIIYTSWFTKFFFWRKKKLISENIISNLIDTLTGIVYLSILSSLFVYPLDYSLYRLQYASIMGQFDPFWFMEAGYIVLQGMFLYRIFELELKDEKDRGYIAPCLYCHVTTVIIFAFGNIIAKFIGNRSIGFLFSPFQDPHSYGGYVLILFFFFVYIGFKKKRNATVAILFALSLLLCIYLSGSAATMISLFFIGAFWCIIVLVKRKRIVFMVSFIIGLMIAIYSVPQFVTESARVNKYVNRLDYSKVLKLKTVTERFELWRQALEIIKEFPLTGSGVGSYFKISNNYSKNEANSGELRNAHNYYFQFAAELGIPALFLFFLILFFIYREGLQIRNSIHGKGLLFGLSAYLISMLSGHHLILSIQQFLFWFVLFAIVYSTNVNFKLKVLSPVLCVLILMVVVGHAFNAFYFKKERKGLYDFGLYKTQMVNKTEMRWTDKVSRKKVHAETDCFGFSMYAEPENIFSGIIEMRIYINNKLIDRVTWKEKGTKYREYHIPGIKGRSLIIRTNASDSYNPYKLGLSKSIIENREQSVAVSDLFFFERSNLKKGILNCNSSELKQAGKSLKKI